MMAAGSATATCARWPSSSALYSFLPALARMRSGCSLSTLDSGNSGAPVLESAPSTLPPVPVVGDAALEPPVSASWASHRACTADSSASDMRSYRASSASSSSRVRMSEERPRAGEGAADGPADEDVWGCCDDANERPGNERGVRLPATSSDLACRSSGREGEPNWSEKSDEEPCRGLWVGDPPGEGPKTPKLVLELAAGSSPRPAVELGPAADVEDDREDGYSLLLWRVARAGGRGVRAVGSAATWRSK